MKSGKIVSYRSDRAFGFIEVTCGKQYFFHIKNWQGEEAPVIGRSVWFELGPGFTSGKSQQAVDIKLVNPEIEIGASALAGGV